MPIIKPLPTDVAAKIAAGEVVERPSSVVKELVENAVDAGVAAIVVEVEGGGMRRIAVTDDGCGMDAADAVSAFQRYATSKIASDRDLANLSTMGFRGEALYAIAAVGEVTLETRSADVLGGVRVEVCGGAAPVVRDAGCPPGTRVEVKRLFFNTPARRKFVKSDGVEFGHISAELTRTALAHPEIAFELHHNGRKVWHHPASSDPRQRLRLIASADEMDAFIELDEPGYGIHITGWIADERVMRASAKDFHVFVNRRPVRDRLLAHGVTAGFGSLLARGSYPAAAVFLAIDPAVVDVNVHPSKREVRFENGAAVHDALQAAVAKALGASRSTRAFGGDELIHAGVRQAIDSFERRRADTAGRDSRSSVHAERGTGGISADSSMPLWQSAARPDSGTRALGQYNRAFIVGEDTDGALILIDQHAAHERLGFEELMRQYREGHVERQQLLFPQTVEMTPAEMAQFEHAAEALAQAGFEVEHFGGSEVIVKAVPAVFGDGDVKHLLERLCEEMEHLGSSTALAERVERMLAVVACHRQVRAGDALGPHEMQQLIDDVMRERIDSCPHGRPAVVRFERREVDRWFKR